MVFLGVSRREGFPCPEEYLVVSVNAFLCSPFKEVYLGDKEDEFILS